jgi:hypothetical protein
MLWSSTFRNTQLKMSNFFTEFRTSDSKEYYMCEVPSNSICTLRFKVKTSNDAHVCLSSSGAQDAIPVVEIFIGGWENKMSAIRRDNAPPEKVLH